MLLHASGYRTLAPDQRGYSPRARPRGRISYRMSQLTEDVVALIEATAPRGGKAHVVGHDWGAAVAWTPAAAWPESGTGFRSWPLQQWQDSCAFTFRARSGGRRR